MVGGQFIEGRVLEASVEETFKLEDKWERLQDGIDEVTRAIEPVKNNSSVVEFLEGRITVLQMRQLLIERQIEKLVEFVIFANSRYNRSPTECLQIEHSFLFLD